MRIARVSWGLLLIGWITSTAFGSSVTITGSGNNGSTTLSASATFSIVTVGSTNYLQVQLANVASAVDDPQSMLTAIFFNYNHAGSSTLLSKTGGFVTYKNDPSGNPLISSTVWFDKSGAWQQFTTGDIPSGYNDSTTSFKYASGNVGGEWGFMGGTSHLSGTQQDFGISASGMNSFGPTSVFDTTENLSPPPSGSPGGVNWGILGAVPTAGTTVPPPLTGTSQTPLAATGILIRLQISGAFNLNNIDDVRFQYGTSTSEVSFGGNNVPNITGVPLPRTASMGIGLLLVLGAGGLAHRRRYHKMP